MKLGKLEVIAGPMYSGKSEELIRRLTRAQIAKKRVLAIKPKIDDRYSTKEIVSHSGSHFEASTDGVEILEKISHHFDVIGIDEAQFFSTQHLLEEVPLAVQNNTLVIVAGLDMTYRQEPFGAMPYLMALADDVTKLSAICHRCGEDAMLTQRLVDGKPASFKGDTIVVGGLDSYEARCRNCFEYAP